MSDLAPGLWQKQNGESIRIVDMADDHLINTIRMLERNSARNLLDIDLFNSRMFAEVGIPIGSYEDLCWEALKRGILPIEGHDLILKEYTLQMRDFVVQAMFVKPGKPSFNLRYFPYAFGFIVNKIAILRVIRFSMADYHAGDVIVSTRLRHLSKMSVADPEVALKIIDALCKARADIVASGYSAIPK